MANRASTPVRYFIILLFAVSNLGRPQVAAAAALRGKILLGAGQEEKPAEVVLRQGKRLISRIAPDPDGNYEFNDLIEGRYELFVRVGAESKRQSVDLFCGPNSVSVIDVNLNRSSPSITFPFSIESHSTVDVVELKRDYPKAVLKEYQKAIWELSPGGNPGKAVMHLRSVVKKAPDFFSARTRLGMVYGNMACYPEAEREYVLARKINPRATQPLLNLAALYLEASGARLNNGRRYLDEAIALLEEAILRQPNSAIAYCLLGAIYYQNKSYEEAEKNLQKAVNMNGRINTAHLFLANIYMRQQKWKDAIKSIDDYLLEAPYSADRKKIKDLRREIEGNLTPAENGGQLQHKAGHPMH